MIMSVEILEFVAYMGGLDGPYRGDINATYFTYFSIRSKIVVGSRAQIKKPAH
jgi:hypothetical protein